MLLLQCFSYKWQWIKITHCFGWFFLTLNLPLLLSKVCSSFLRESCSQISHYLCCSRVSPCVLADEIILNTFMIHSSLGHWGIELPSGLEEFGLQVKKKTIEAQAKISNKSEFMISLLVFTLFLWLGGLCFVCLIFGVFLSVWGFFHTEAFAILWWKFKWKNSSVQLPWDGYGLKEHPNLFLWECWAQRKEKGCSASGHSWSQHMWKGSCQIWKYLFKATINCSLALGLGSIFPQIAQLSLQHRLEWENCQPLLALLWAGGLLSYRGKGFLHSMRDVILFTVRKWHLCYHFIC